MDLSTFITFIGGGSLVAMLLTQVLKRGLKSISDRYGALATQVVLLVVSLIVAGIVNLSPLVPQHVLVLTGSIFTGAILIYEILYKAIWQQAIKGHE